LTAATPDPMLEYLRRHRGLTRVPGVRRKLRLLGCGAARLVWGHFPDSRYHPYVERAEGLADAGVIHGGMLSFPARTPVEDAAGRLVPVLIAEACLKNTKLALWAAADLLVLSLRARGGVGLDVESAVALRAPAEADNARLVRCVFGNPFSAAKFDPA